LFGASIPLTKWLAGTSDPLILAGLLYLGAGTALTGVRASHRAAEAPLRRQDAPWLAGIVLSGAVVGPVLLVIGLRRLPGVPGALLLNLEAPLTAVLAVAAFREHLSGRGWAAIALLAAGAAALAAAVLSVPLLGERLALRDAVAAALMAGGILLLLREQHAHEHVHDPVEHEHLHVHDEHHRHSHEDGGVEPHSHPHAHERMEHAHPHASDVHHRHRH